MSDEKDLVDRARALMEKATPGPWRNPEGYEFEVYAGEHGIAEFYMPRGRAWTSTQSEANAALCAAAPTLLRDLADRVRELEGKASQGITAEALAIAGHQAFMDLTGPTYHEPGGGWLDKDERYRDERIAWSERVLQILAEGSDS